MERDENGADRVERVIKSCGDLGISKVPFSLSIEFLLIDDLSVVLNKLLLNLILLAPRTLPFGVFNWFEIKI